MTYNYIMSFEEKIQKWVALDNQIKRYNDEIKKLREEKNALGIGLTEQATTDGYIDSTIQISDGKLRFVNTKVTSSLTFKYIEETLDKVVPDSDSRERIINCLKTNRDTKVVTELKRYNSN